MQDKNETCVRCAGCGLVVPEGTVGCQAQFDLLVARDFTNVLYGRWHRLMVDTYCLQHPEAYCVSAKSLAAHLGGMCCAMEHDGHPSTYRALQRWLSGRAPVEKPELPWARGELTIAEARAAPDVESYANALRRWARSTWEAYAALHVVARGYVQAALAGHFAVRST